MDAAFAVLGGATVFVVLVLIAYYVFFSIGTCVLVGVCDKTFLKWSHETQYNIQIENYQKLQEKKN